MPRRPAPVASTRTRARGRAAEPITTIHPRTYNEAKTIGESFRDGTPVIMNLSDMGDADAKRLVDFAAGLVFGLHGTIERVTSKVFLLPRRCTSRSPPKRSRRPHHARILQPVVAPLRPFTAPDRTRTTASQDPSARLDVCAVHRHGVLHRRLPVLPDPHRTVGFRLGPSPVTGLAAQGRRDACSAEPRLHRDRPSVATAPEGHPVHQPGRECAST